MKTRITTTVLLASWLVSSASVAIAAKDTPNTNQIGEEFVTRQTLLLKGVKRPWTAKKPAFYALVPLPGIGGREIVALGELPAGTRIRVIGMIEEERLFGNKVEYEVIILDSNPLERTPVRIWNSYYALRLYTKDSKYRPFPILDPAHFRSVAAPK